uniref:Ig-like domain-containing protein n=1 Tax=Salmo trutta TaxID=8032 RepID=A0A673VW01_SALTR
MSLYVSLYYMSSSYFPGVSGVTVVTQKPPVVTVRKGDTATMDCNLGTVENSAARWYKQVPGGSKSDYCLIINNVEEADSAVYYCQTHDGTKLIVTDGDLATPAVTLFPPSTEDLKSSRATLVCLASNLSQRSKGLADVSWMSNGESVTEDVSTSPAEQQPDKTFKISSYLTIQTAEWDKDVVFTCKVSLGSTFSEKEIRKTSCTL